jgi:hypothetical protein
MIAEMARVCRRKGRILVEFRNSRHLLQRIKFRLAPFYDPTIRDLPLETYSCDDIKDCFRNFSCRVRDSRGLWGRGLSSAVVMMEAEKI